VNSQNRKANAAEGDGYRVVKGAEPKKVKCYGVIATYYNRPNAGYSVNGEPYVLFYKKPEHILDPIFGGNTAYVNNGDVVIEFQEVARYKLKKTGVQLESEDGAVQELA
jgi:hypothetical protein